MSTEPQAAKPKLLWIKLAIVVAVLATGGLLMMSGVDVRGWIDRGMNLVRNTGPVTFFTAMALTPAIGVPASLFTLTAGTAFGPTMGMFWVIVLCMVAVLINVALTHWLARYAFRPLLEKLVVRLGYKLPQVAPENTTDLAVLVRVTPGSPFPVQNYLLGLAGVPLARNLLVVFIVQAFYLPAFVLFGDALQHGKGKVAIMAIGLLAAAAAGTHLLRKHYAKKKKSG